MKKIKTAIGASVGAAAVALSVLGGVIPANAASNGNLEQAFNDYINGVSQGVMTPQSNGNQQWDFTYQNGVNTVRVDTYIVGPGGLGGQVPYTFVGSEIEDKPNELPHVHDNAK